ncbi:caspase family protein [Halpernia sp.]|uniref:caspase family protein n=1 Tax=Halpernia sp. TaxID=2782209 RepID=UPI003A8ECC6D
MKTLAIVIGNNNYHENSKLDNAENDANAIADALLKLGYHVKKKLNTNTQDIQEILDYYSKEIKNYDASIFYFAGHGFELDGENFLTGIDCQIPPSDQYSAGRNSIRLNEIFEIYKKNPTKLNIVILDACRRSFGRGDILGFSPIKAPKGNLIAFSTSPDSGSDDVAYGDHSIYTGSLLKYIGEERISVEELFKNVRKTVFAQTKGKQTTWEHTSLIDDFYFYKSPDFDILSLNYDDDTIKDINYFEDSNFGKLILGMKSRTWDTQNSAINSIVLIDANSLSNSQKFILGRNMLQCAVGGSRSAENFFQNLKFSIQKYQDGKENHVLNGILFEMYFDSKAEFRFAKTKSIYKENLFSLIDNAAFKLSFDFISKLLQLQEYELIFIPNSSPKVFNVEVIAVNKVNTDATFGNSTFQKIEKIIYNNTDITKEIQAFHIYGKNENALKKELANFFCATVDQIKVNSTVELEKISFDYEWN